MKTLTASELLSAKLDMVKIELKGQGYVFVKEPTGLERSNYEDYIGTLKDDESAVKMLRAYCAVRCLCGEDGVRLFSDEQIDVVNASMSSDFLDEILAAFNKIILGKDYDIEKAAKKSQGNLDV